MSQPKKTRRTNKQIHIEKRLDELFDSLEYYAPEDICSLIVGYAGNAEVADACSISKINDMLEVLLNCFRFSFSPRNLKQSKDNVFEYLTLKQTLKNNWDKYKLLIYSRPSCHSILIQVFQQGFSFLNHNIDRIGPDIPAGSPDGTLAEGPHVPWEVALYLMEIGHIDFPEAYYDQ